MAELVDASGLEPDALMGNTCSSQVGDTQSVVQLVEPLIWDQEVGCSIHPTLTSIYNWDED